MTENPAPAQPADAPTDVPTDVPTGVPSAAPVASATSADTAAGTPVALPEPTTARPEPGQLTFRAPRRGKPPRHLADLSPTERKEAVESLGHKGFRAKQLSTHYFERLVDDPEEMTDLPKA